MEFSSLLLIGCWEHSCHIPGIISPRRGHSISAPEKLVEMPSCRFAGSSTCKVSVDKTICTESPWESLALIHTPGGPWPSTPLPPNLCQSGGYHPDLKGHFSGLFCPAEFIFLKGWCLGVCFAKFSSYSLKVLSNSQIRSPSLFCVAGISMILTFAACVFSFSMEASDKSTFCLFILSGTTSPNCFL